MALHPKRRHCPTYRCWQNMHLKCRNQCSKSYKNFGGRGIKVCDRWKTFDGFLADMGEKPSEGFNTFLNRLDKSADFTPENCFWSTRMDWDRSKSDAQSGDLAGKTIASKGFQAAHHQ